MAPLRHWMVSLSCFSGLAGLSLYKASWFPQRSSSVAIVNLSRRISMTPLDDLTYQRIDSLRREAGLPDDTLVALNLDQNGYESTLTAIRAWDELHGEQFATRQAAVASAAVNVRLLRAAIESGADSQSELNEARSQLEQARGQLNSLLGECRASVIAGLTEGQQALVIRMHGDQAVPMPYRVLDLNSEQRGALRKASIRYSQRRANAPSQELRDAAQQLFDEELTEALGSNNLSQLQAMLANFTAASNRLVAAIQTALPRINDGDS